MTWITDGALRTVSAGGHPKAIREWAWSRGINIARRGAIPGVVIDAYYRAHPEVERIAS